MLRPRLMTVIITTPRTVRGQKGRLICAVPAQQNLRLDAPHQVKVHKALFFVGNPEPQTSIVFQYSAGFAESAAYNDGEADIEGQIITAVKQAFALDEVFWSSETIDWKRG